MEKSTTSDRLRLLMGERNLRQIDIIKLCEPFCKKYGIKLGRNDLSQYVSGKVLPGQDKLTILGQALDVSEAWLMGFDVQKSRTPTTLGELSQIEKDVIYAYRKSDNITKTMVHRLLNVDESNDDQLLAAHRRTDIEVSADDINHDINIMKDDSEWDD